MDHNNGLYNEETTPDNTPKKVRPLHGVLIFIVGMILFMTLGFQAQYRWGMLGLAITEVIILLIGLVPILIFKLDWKEVLPLRRPKIKEILGTLLLWGGSYIMVMAVTMAIACFFPDQVYDTSNSLSGAFSSIPLLLSFLVVAVMPAICEEVMHRGMIQYTLRNIKSDALVVAIMALFFGIFHLDPVRFLPTAILGGSLAYVMVKTHNFFLPMLFHFINNSLSVIASAFTDPEVAASVELTSESAFLSFGSMLTMCVLVPPLLIGASLLFKSKEALKRMEKKQIILLVVLGIAIMGICFISGIGIVTWGVMNSDLSNLLHH